MSNKVRERQWEDFIKQYERLLKASRHFLRERKSLVLNEQMAALTELRKATFGVEGDRNLLGTYLQLMEQLEEKVGKMISALRVCEAEEWGEDALLPEEVDEVEDFLDTLKASKLLLQDSLHEPPER